MDQWKYKRIRESLYPESVAILGVSDAANNLGRQMVDGLALQGFSGKIYLVHPRLKELLGHKVYPNLEAIGEKVDLVVSSLNAKITTESVIESCAKIGAKGIVCFAGGFKEVGDEGLRYEKRLKEVADANQIIIFGPNILGIANNESRLYATFWSFKERNPLGSISILGQSGGIATVMFSALIDQNIGINKWVCLGNRTNLEFSDMFHYLAEDEGTKVIMAFVEAVENGRDFMEAAHSVALKKPLILLRGARNESTRHVATSHTGTMGGNYQIFRSLCRQYQILEVDNSNDLATVCKALSLSPKPSGDRVAVFTHTAGPSILTLDTLIEHGCPLAKVSPETLLKIKGLIGESTPVVLSPNPIDVTGSGFFVDIYSKCVETVLEDSGVDVLIVIYAVHRNYETPAKALAALQRRTSKPILACIVSSKDEIREDEKILREAGIPIYQTPEEAALAASYLVKYYKLSS